MSEQTNQTNQSNKVKWEKNKSRKTKHLGRARQGEKPGEMELSIHPGVAAHLGDRSRKFWNSTRPALAT